jgi:hypothetical protein
MPWAIVPVILNDELRWQCLVWFENIRVRNVGFARPETTARLAFWVLAVQAEVIRGGDDGMPLAKTRKIEHERNGDAEPHLLLIGELTPLIPSYCIAFVDHGRVLCTDRAENDENWSQTSNFAQTGVHLHIELAGTRVHERR